MLRIVGLRVAEVKAPGGGSGAVRRRAARAEVGGAEDVGGKQGKAKKGEARAKRNRKSEKDIKGDGRPTGSGRPAGAATTVAAAAAAGATATTTTTTTHADAAAPDVTNGTAQPTTADSSSSSSSSSAASEQAKQTKKSSTPGTATADAPKPGTPKSAKTRTPKAAKPRRKLSERISGAVRQPTEAGQLRRRVLFYLPLPVPVFVLVAIATGGHFSAPGWIILVSGSVAVGTLLMALIVQPTPLPEGLSAEASVRRSLHRFRQFTSLRIGLALAAIAVGAGASLAGGGLFPLIASIILAWPQLLLALPNFRAVTRARRAMEAWGTNAYLWAALAQPAPVQWPLFSRLSVRRAKRRAATASATATAATGAKEDEPAVAKGEPVEPDARDSDLPERLAVTATEPKVRPETIIPGFPTANPAPRPSRPAVRQRANSRPAPRQSRSGTRRSKAKN